MNVLVIYVPNLMAGGAEKVCVNLANAISDYGTTKVYLMTEYGGDYENLVSAKVHRIDITNRSLISVLLFLYKIKPDVIMSTLASANVRLSILKIFLFTKTVFITRSPAIFRKWKFEKTIKSKLLSFLDERAYRFSDFVIANSPDTAYSINMCCKVPFERIFTIGNPVYSIKRKPSKETNNIVVTKPYILAVGSFKQVKRYDIMLDVYNIVSKETNVDLNIIGDGLLKDEIKRKIKELKLDNKVHLLGIMSDLEEYYRKAECLIHCSEYEGFGNVLVEALSYGTIPICFKSPGGPNYILEDGKYGILVPFGDVETMANRVLDVLNRTITFNNNDLIRRAEFFSIDVKAKEYYNLFVKLYKIKFG